MPESRPEQRPLSRTILHASVGTTALYFCGAFGAVAISEVMTGTPVSRLPEFFMSPVNQNATVQILGAEMPEATRIVIATTVGALTGLGLGIAGSWRLFRDG